MRSTRHTSRTSLRRARPIQKPLQNGVKRKDARLKLGLPAYEEFLDHRAAVRFLAELLQDGLVAVLAWPGEHLPGQFVDLAGQPLVNFPGDAPQTPL